MSSTSGLRGVVAGNSKICTVDGIEGKLTYAGIPIQELAEHASFEEVVYLLWHQRLPNQAELDALKADLAANAALDPAVIALLRTFPKDAKPMDTLRTGVSALGLWDPEQTDNSLEANFRKAIRLTAKMSTLVATLESLRQGKEPVAPRADLSHAANFLYMLSGEVPSEIAARTFDVALTLHADHEFNASTFAARVTIATLTDMYAAITSAVGTLAGPLHGGANEAVFRMLQEIGTIENVEPYLKAKLDAKAKIMGFGHAVYKTTDPRAANLKKMSRALTVEAGVEHLFDLSEKVEAMMLEAKGLYANVDFYSASVYHVLGIPVELFTPVFAVSRVSGWTAHVLEQLADNRIIRPRAEYVGPVDQHYVPIEQR